MLNNVGRFEDEKFMPTQSDLQAFRKFNNGIYNINFTYDQLEFKCVIKILFFIIYNIHFFVFYNIHFFVIYFFIFSVWDITNQTGEKRKWIHCFEYISLFIFCVDLLEYVN